MSTLHFPALSRRLSGLRVLPALGFFLLVGVFAGLAACGGAGAPEELPRAGEAAPVEVEKLVVVEWPEHFEAVGTVQARQTAFISSKIVSYVRQIKVRAGDHVKAGQLLVELDDRDLRSQLEQSQAARIEVEQAIAEAAHALLSSQAQLVLAQATHRRYSDLVAKESVSRQEFDEVDARLRGAEAAVEMMLARQRQAEAKRAQAEARVEQAHVALGYARIEAPFDGVVTERMLDPGSLANPAAPILSVDRMNLYRMEAALPELQAGLVRVGTPVTVRLEAGTESIVSRVSEIVPHVDPGSRTFAVRIDLPARSSLRGGMFGRVLFTGDVKSVLTVPVSAVTERGQLRSVLVVQEETAGQRLISLGERRGERSEVLSGLREGEQVVLHPGQVRDGQSVRVERVLYPESPSPDDAERRP